MTAMIGKYGDIGFEVVKDGRQIGFFRARSRSQVDVTNGRTHDIAPTDDDLAEARRHAETFAAAIG